MSQPTPPPDPYQSPAYFADQDVPDEVMIPRRPGGLTAICVIAIILGVLGVITALMGIVGAVAGQAMQKAMAPSMPQNMNEEAQQVQEEMNEAIQEVGQKFMVPNVVSIICSLTLAIGLIVGGSQSLKIKPSGRTILLMVFSIAILFELVRGGFQIYVQMQILAVMDEFWPRIVETSAAQQGQGGPDLETIMSVLWMVTKVSAYVFTILPVLLKAGYYVIGALYLGRENVKRLFDQSADAQSPFGSANPAI
jgi:hypothetical protein